MVIDLKSRSNLSHIYQLQQKHKIIIQKYYIYNSEIEHCA